MGRLSVPRPLWTGVETDRLGPRSVGTGVAGVSPPQARSCQFFLLVGLPNFVSLALGNGSF